MTPTELYELVKDVPREAWPACLSGWNLFMWADDAVLLFEASMMRWLCVRGCSLHSWDELWKVRMPKKNPRNEDDRFTWTPNYKEPCEALSAACKAVAGE